MSVFEKVLTAHKEIIKLETEKGKKMQEILDQQYATIGGRMFPIDPAQKAAAAKQVQLEYDAKIAEEKKAIHGVLETAEKGAKRNYYNAIPMGSEYDYRREIDHIIRSHESSTLHPNLRDSKFFDTVRAHTELGDKWALVYVLAGLELFPGNTEIMECLDKIAPEVAQAKVEIAEVFELAYFGARTATTPLESIHIKTRLAELGANPNITLGVDNAAVYEAFVQSLGINIVKPTVTELGGRIGNDYAGGEKNV